MCLQETKLKLVSRSLVRRIWSCIFVDRVYLASDEASGGILLMWDRRVVEKLEVFMGSSLWHVLLGVWKMTSYGLSLVWMGLI